MITRRSATLYALLLWQFSALAFAQGPGPGPGPGGPGPNNNNFAALGEATAPAENPITEAKRVLGKILFWDEQLSSDNTVACGTCHQPAAGGSDLRLGMHPGFDEIFGTADDVVGSPGIRMLDSNAQPAIHPQFGLEPQVTNRASPSFFTSMFDTSNFWDGRATDEFVDPLDPDSVIIPEGGALESQAIAPILSTVEMAHDGRDWDDVVSKLSLVKPLALASNIPDDMQDALAGNQSYGDLFSSAFGDEAITPVRIAFAIASYERTLVPNETPWDLYIEGNDSAMTASQIAGWESYIDTPCANCHEPPLFSDDAFRNIGLRPSGEDLGRFEVTGNRNDRGEFRTPSLRNVGLRKMLMHVGWVTDVDDAIAFYNSGANDTGHTQFLDDQDGIPGNPLDINELDVFADDDARRAELVDFLANGLTDPRVANETFPFDRPTLASEAQEEVQAIAGRSATSSSTNASFRITALDTNGDDNAGVFTTADIISIAGTIEVDPADIGDMADLYCVVMFNGSPYMMNNSGSFTAWDGNEATLTSLASRQLSSIEIISIVDGLPLTGLVGQMDIHIAYENADQVLIYSSSPVSLSITE